ncbi:MAG: tetratricopeptide repeat protein, partial [Planctomycetes bacterium]|nr:tetratricopeptide repeat protein [Planctomycetota bacterium]
KPSNIMVGAFGEVHVMDWGLAKVLGRADGDATDETVATAAEPPPPAAVATLRSDSAASQSRSGSVMGSPAYMPPEQARGEVESVDERADVFSLGAILCECLTGRPPYTGSDPVAVRHDAAAALLEEAHQRLDRCGADPEVVQLTRQCLAATRDARPRNAAEVARAFSAHLASADERARAAEIAAARAQAQAAAARRAKRLTIALAASILTALVLVGGGYGWFAAKRRAQAAAATSDALGALDEAALLRTRARAASPADPVPWVRALEAARHAGALARREEVHAPVRARATAFLAEVEAEEGRVREAAARAERDAATRRELEEIRLRAADLWETVQDFEAPIEAAYAGAFRGYGIDVDLLEAEEAARRIRASSIREELLTALDDWVGVRTRRSGEEKKPRPDQPRSWKRLHDIAQAADPDLRRQRIREAYMASDVATLTALARSEEMLALAPNTLDVLANMLGAHGAVGSAIALLEQARQQYPGDFWIHYGLAYWSRRAEPAGREQAIAGFRAATALRPISAGAWLQLGFALLEDNQPEAARAAFEKTMQVRPEANTAALARFGIGESLRRQGRLAEARTAYEQGLGMQPENTRALLAHASLLVDLDLEEEAAAAIERLLALSPISPEAQYERGALLRKLGRTAEAMAAYEEAIRGRPDLGRAHNDLGVLLREAGKPDEALAAFERAAAADPRLPQPHHNRAGLLAERGQLEAAIAANEKALELDPGFFPALNDLGALLARTGEKTRALAALRKAVALQPGNATCLFNLGELLSQLGAHEEAVRCIEKSLEIRPDDLSALCALAAICTNDLKDPDRAIGLLEKAVALDPRHALAQFNLGVALLGKGRREAAAAQFQRAAEVRPDYVDALINLGAVREMMQDLRGAAEAFRAAVKVQPDHKNARNYLAEMLLKLGAHDEALAVVRESIAQDSHDAAAHFYEGTALQLKGEYARAAAAFQRVIVFRGDHALAHLWLGHTRMKLDDPRGAAEAYEAAAKLQPDLEGAHYHLAVARYHLGDFAGALEVARRTLELAPAYTNAARLAAECERMQALEAELPVLRSGDPAQTAGRKAEVARLCHLTRRYAAAAEWWAAALEAAGPGTPEGASHRYRGARAAALAGCGRGTDAEALPDGERARWRAQALAWLRAELERCRAEVAGGGDAIARVRASLAEWQGEAELEAVRDREFLALLPAAERAVWSSFWREVAAIAGK